MAKKVLLPIDGSDRDSMTINYVKDNFNPENTEIALLNVGEVVFVHGMPFAEVMEEKKKIGNEILDKASKELSKFTCTKEILFGYADKQIIEYTAKNSIDTIVMAKNTKKKFSAIVGSVTAQVLKKSNCTMIILPQA